MVEGDGAGRELPSTSEGAGVSAMIVELVEGLLEELGWSGSNGSMQVFAT